MASEKNYQEEYPAPEQRDYIAELLTSDRARDLFQDYSLFVFVVMLMLGFYTRIDYYFAGQFITVPYVPILEAGGYLFGYFHKATTLFFVVSFVAFVLSPHAAAALDKLVFIVVKFFIDQEEDDED